jgi:hypothetical protein
MAMAESVVQDAAERVRFTTSDWQLSPARPLEASEPRRREWSHAAAREDVDPAPLPAPGEALLLQFEVDTAKPQALWITYAGGSGSAVWLDGKPVPPSAPDAPGQRFSAALLSLDSGKHAVRLKMAGLESAEPCDVRLDPVLRGFDLSADWPTLSLEQRWERVISSEGSFARMQWQKEALALNQRLTNLTAGFTTTLIAQELEQGRATHILKRGEYDQPSGDPLEPGILKVMGAFPDSTPRNRLGLAQWLTSPDHPLVARVLVNRLW